MEEISLNTQKLAAKLLAICEVCSKLCAQYKYNTITRQKGGKKVL